MIKTRSTKRALLMSALALLMCVSMLVGSTMAWFTDSVTSTGNKIQAGTLKLDLEMYNTESGKYESIKESKVAIFNYTKWEPGYTDVKLLKIENEGTLALKWYTRFVSDNAVTALADVIDVYVLSSETELQMPADRDLTGYEKVGTVREFINTIETTTKGTLNGLSSAYLGIALKMQETANNDYQGLTIGEFDIQIVATQATVESDSFGTDYDANAAFYPWDGTVPTEMPATLVVDGATQTVHVKDAAAFVYLSTLSEEWADLYTDGNGRTYTNYANGAGANYYYSGQWTVSLEADIDLKNYAIAPVSIVFGESTGATEFNGNGHTIRNINTTTGLFAPGTRANFSYLTLENVSATNGALSANATSIVSNVTVKNATISGVDYVGGLVGKTYSSIQGCKVIDSTVVASGKEAGGLVGYAETNSLGSTIANNVVTNVTVYANNRAAGLVAQPNVNIKVYNNTVDTVTVGVEDDSTYLPGAVVSNALEPANVYDNTVVNANVAESAIAIVADQADFKNVIKSADDGTTIVLTADVTATTDAWDRYTGGMGMSVSIDGCGNTIKILTQITDPNYSAVLRFEKDAVIKNVVFDLSNANPNGGRFRAISSKGDLVVDNCTFIGNPAISNTRGIIFGEGSGAAIGEVDVTITNCTFIDLTRGITDNENGQDVKTLKIENCKFTNAGVNVSAGESITFTGNELVNSDVRLVSYKNGDTVKVTATGNDLTASADKVIAIMKVTNAANITKQDEFIVY